MNQRKPEHDDMLSDAQLERVAGGYNGQEPVKAPPNGNGAPDGGSSGGGGGGVGGVVYSDRPMTGL